jgi:hypothetical protein
MHWLFLFLATVMAYRMEANITTLNDGTYFVDYADHVLQNVDEILQDRVSTLLSQHCHAVMPTPDNSLWTAIDVLMTPIKREMRPKRHASIYTDIINAANPIDCPWLANAIHQCRKHPNFPEDNPLALTTCAALLYAPATDLTPQVCQEWISDFLLVLSPGAKCAGSVVQTASKQLEHEYQVDTLNQLLKLGMLTEEQRIDGLGVLGPVPAPETMDFFAEKKGKEIKKNQK